jgi:alkaline phosphatase D
MTNSFVFKTERPWPNARLREGVIVGHTTATSAKIWVRTGQPGSFALLFYPTSMRGADKFRQRLRDVPFDATRLPAKVRQIEFKLADFSSDTTAVLALADLLPYTDYSYALYGTDISGNRRILLGQDIGKDELAYSFRTLSDGVRPISFGFYSCHMPYSESIFGRLQIENMEMWDSFALTLRRHREKGQLAFLIGGGDQVYVDGIDSLSIWNYLNSCLKKNPGVFPDKGAMLSWYRDTYRGYWGFPQLREIFSRCPTYMIWDDHELGDGWGSYFFKQNSKKDEMDEIFPDWQEKGLQYQDCVALLKNMEDCAKQVYQEYQHSHNPDPVADGGQFDYSVTANGTALYFLDGRGNRDVNKKDYRILSRPQLARFGAWLAALDPKTTPFVFVISAVPLMHLKSAVANADNVAVDIANVEDDLRDAWEHRLHETERKELVRLLFEAANRGLKISILSGDVHVSAAFRMTDQSGNIIYQLTSSAITYNVPRPMGWALGLGVEDTGTSSDGYDFKRLALYTGRNYAMVCVDPAAGKADFQLYGPQSISHPRDEQDDLPITHSMVKIELTY